MNNRYQYRAFGLTIESDFPIIQIPLETFDTAPDVIIRDSDLSELKIVPDDGYVVRNDGICFAVENLGKFRMSNGDSIEVELYPDCQENRLSLFLMGSCMGSILHQRDALLLHGSCITNGTYAILITGKSGAGKSTLASEFLAHGWKLITDDVTVITDVETVPAAQSSYPSQKLWRDSLIRYDRKDEDIHSLYINGAREKFGVNVSDSFFSGKCPVNLIIRLVPANCHCHIQSIEGMTRVDQLLRNTYQLHLVTSDKKQDYFRRCVALADKVQMALVLRENGRQCAGELYEMIVDYIGRDDNG